MDVVGSEIGQKMRSAIKAKLTELGCYVDDELPDYVMVMVANKRTRSQMEDDLQLFLGDNTELFVNWLHQVLKKLQEVTVAPLKTVESDKVKERSKSKEKKDKKEKSKKSDGSKKSKKKAKEKAHKKKDERKKSKKRSKHEMIRPNIPPLLMNIEKESEPSITDVFAGQILKNHGIILDTHTDEPKIVEKKPVLNETKRPIIPIIDPASIPSQTTADIEEVSTIDSETVTSIVTENDVSMTMTEDDTMLETAEDVVTLTSENVISPKPTDIAPEAENASREDKIKEMNEIEAKIQGLKQKLADQLVSQDDSMSDDEDFLNIRTEADELINDFAEDVFQEISQPPPIATPPLRPRISRSPSPPPPTNNKKKVTSKDIPETLPQIELNLPKRPVRERLGAPIQKKDAVDERDKGRRASEKSTKTPERCTPEKAPVERSDRSAKSRLGSQPERSETHRKSSTSDESAKSEHSSKRLTSRVSVLENRPARATCASVVRVRPRPRVGAPASSLLLRAVADAHKSLLNIPPKVDPEPQKVKRALVLPMRRTVDPKKIVIQVPCNNAATNSAESVSDVVSLGNPDSEEEESPRWARNLTDKEEYKTSGITKVIQNTDYVPSRTLIRRDDTLLVETINIHNTTVDKDKDTQFIVTMDGYHPNAFLAKKLMTEGLLNDDDNDVIKKPNQSDNVEKSKNGENTIYERAKKIADVVSEDTTKTSEKSTDQTMDEDRDVIEKEKSDNSIKDTTPENRSNVAVAKLIPEKRKSDITPDNLILEKRKRDIPPETAILENRKREVLVVKPIMETENDNSIEISAPEKRKSISSTDKPVPEGKKSDISADIPILDTTSSDISLDRPTFEKQKSDISLESSASENDKSSPVKRRRASPIVFDVHKTEKVPERVRERTVSASSDGHVVLTTATNSHKYDALPPLSQAAKVVWCRAFPQCRYGQSCAFAHPRCKFAAACTRRGCMYSHAPNAIAAPTIPSAPLVGQFGTFDFTSPTVSQAAKVVWCRAFPQCRYGQSCAFAHPRCKFAAACTRRGCMYSHAPNAIAAPTIPSAPLVGQFGTFDFTSPTVSQAAKVVWCRAFPQCRYGQSCAFAHPRCKFAAACTRRGCMYSHAPNAIAAPTIPSAPLVASHVVPAANYKSISAAAFAGLCKYYPNCSNPACHYYHPKPCRYGKACTNKLECNFYHHDVPGGKWMYSV